MNESLENCTMKQASSFDYKMKRKVDDVFYLMNFAPDEYEVAATLLSMPKPIEEDDKRRKSNKYNVDSAPQINIPNVVMENEYNPSDIPTIPDIPSSNILGCCKPFEKKLYNSDLNADLNRLVLSKNHVKTYFLPLLIEGEEDVRDGINVVVYDMQGNTFNMMFKCWSKDFYVLNGKGWMDFIKTHELKVIEDYVTVWMFRHSETNKLCFALSVRRVQT